MRGFPALQRVDLGEVDYAEAAVAMEGWARECREGRAGDRLFLLTHPPVVTYGPRTPAEHLPTVTAGLPTVRVDRGGQATYHGPGQLVGYLVAHVRERGPADVVRWLENGLVDALHGLGFPALRRDTPPGGASLVGVWTPEHRKVGSIGMRIRGGVSTHGFSLNIDPDLAVYDRFLACGLDDPTTSLREWAGSAPDEAAVRDAVARALHATERPAA
ncbi:MAG: lipoyl(octanoyl) transferase LipB [Saccharothrix sp.]|nr:lipoyl(octanoyl) transferase LipB [Saccharothrix sp.]